MKRLVTALIAGTLLLAAVFLLPSLPFFLLCTVMVLLAAGELVRLARHYAPAAPFALLLVVVPALAVVLVVLLPIASDPPWNAPFVAMAAFMIVLLFAVAVVLSRTPVEHGLVAVGILSFAVPYLVLPVVSLHALQQLDPWLLVLLFAVVWLGDSAAYYVGSAVGRRKMAPRLSPNKTWEGAAAGLAASVSAASAWSAWRLDGVEPAVVVLAAVTAIAAQLGDLMESLIKRGAGVKDSGGLLPGHGGALDRLDALLFAAPCLYAGVRLIGADAFVP